MTIRSDRAIKARRGMSIEPFDPERAQGSSYDLRTSPWIRIFDYTNVPFVDPANPESLPTKLLNIHDTHGDFFLMPAMSLAFVSTLERISLDAQTRADLSGRSSTGRMGLFVHITAGVIDPGWDGHITLELFNAHPIPLKLTPDMDLCQITFSALDLPCEHPYDTERNRYQGQGAWPQPALSARVRGNNQDGKPPEPFTYESGDGNADSQVHWKQTFTPPHGTTRAW